MLQHALRRLLPSPVQAQTAAGLKLGDLTQGYYYSSESTKASQPQTPFLSLDSRDDARSQSSSNTAVPQHVMQLSNMMARPYSSLVRSTALGTPSIGFAASPLLATPSIRTARLATPPRMMLPAVKGLGLGLTNPSTGMQQTRAYGNDGQLMGAAYLLTTDLMFWTGLIGAVVFRRNLIVMLLATEIVMLACNMNFLFGAAYLNDMTGVIMSITITTIAACETAIGLALCVTYFHIRSATDVEALNFLK